MKVRNFAHRGARSLAPENTLAAIEKAWEIGTDGVEVDVQITADGHLVLFHDTLVTRTTDIAEIYPERTHGSVASFRLAELQQLDAGSWYLDTDPFGQISEGALSFEEMERFQKCRIPTLAEVLLFIRNKDWRINLELKSATAPPGCSLGEETVRLLDRLCIESEQIIISSYDHAELEHVQRLDSGFEINALIGGDNRTNDWGSFDYSVYNANAAMITEKQITRAREHGCRVNLYTVNEPEEMSRFIDWGVSGIITDFPQILVRLQQTEPDRETNG
ncbi:MAG: glycerophosphodiester phosphodiesterase [Proteobacteria bacterium]|nr:MAG: glycerophosphodiester phosphodiesterase [Pseudomonadota bacterium]